MDFLDLALKGNSIINVIPKIQSIANCWINGKECGIITFTFDKLEYEIVISKKEYNKLTSFLEENFKIKPLGE